MVSRGAVKKLELGMKPMVGTLDAAAYIPSNGT